VTRRLAIVLVFAMAAAGVARADLKAALAERDLGRRSKLALDNAASAMKEARAAFEKGDNEKLAEYAREVQESVDLAYESLQSTGKDPRKSPKWFKHAEIETRDLLKKVDTLQHDLSFQDRPLLDKLKARVQQVHDELLLGLMEGKKK
jgi:phytoene dehydrogenase-like protein